MINIDQNSDIKLILITPECNVFLISIRYIVTLYVLIKLPQFLRQTPEAPKLQTFHSILAFDNARPCKV